ncbi:hypothetical protein [Kalamiella sp. sgz302252]|uniref:hypothetical protein n=1 Tax=Pantoea sp. sgz302252 TaxID=3341827 RepID=UPI0036D4026D
MISWEDFINALGKEENSSEFLNLCGAIGEIAEISEDSEEYNDPVSRTKYYKFFLSGIEMGFRHNILNHIHFYFDNADGFSTFKGSLLFGINIESTDKLIHQKLGEPVSCGGGKMDMLIGYINKWVKYQYKNYALHLQFNQLNKLYRSTLMK